MNAAFEGGKNVFLAAQGQGLTRQRSSRMKVSLRKMARLSASRSVQENTRLTICLIICAATTATHS